MVQVPRTRRFQERGDAIIEAAVRRFNLHGVKGVTLADIASDVGLATNSITYYYRRKEDLASECFLRSIAVIERLALEAGSQADSVHERLSLFFRAHARTMSAIDRGQHPPLMRFSDLRSLPEPHARDTFRRFEDLFRAVRRLLESSETTGLGRAELTGRAHLVLTLSHWMRLWAPRFFEHDQYAWVGEQVADLLANGLASRRARFDRPGRGRSWHLIDRPDAGVPDFLQAATVLVNEQGYRGASVDKISAHLKVTKGSFYHHNEGKDDLIEACFERSFAVIRRALAQAREHPGRGWDRLRAVGEELIRFQLSELGPLLRNSAVTALPGKAQRDALGVLGRLGWEWRCLLLAGMQDGSLRVADPTIAAFATIEMINAAAELRRWVPGITLESAQTVYLRPMLAGVLTA